MPRHPAVLVLASAMFLAGLAARGRRPSGARPAHLEPVPGSAAGVVQLGGGRPRGRPGAPLPTPDRRVAQEHRHGARAHPRSAKSSSRPSATRTPPSITARRPRNCVSWHASNDATRADRFRASFRAGFDYLLAAQYQTAAGRSSFRSAATIPPHHVQRRCDGARDGGGARHGGGGAAVCVRRFRAPCARGQGRATGHRAHSQGAGARAGTVDGLVRQHDEVTLAPAKARTYEHPSLQRPARRLASCRSSLSIPKPPPPRSWPLSTAGIAWLRDVRLTGLRVETREGRLAAGRVRRVRGVKEPGRAARLGRVHEIARTAPSLGRDSVFRDRWRRSSTNGGSITRVTGIGQPTCSARDYRAGRTAGARGVRDSGLGARGSDSNETGGRQATGRAPRTKPLSVSGPEMRFVGLVSGTDRELPRSPRASAHPAGSEIREARAPSPLLVL